MRNFISQIPFATSAFQCTQKGVDYYKDISFHCVSELLKLAIFCTIGLTKIKYLNMQSLLDGQYNNCIN